MKKQGFGDRIAQARKEAGFSQKRLLKALGWPDDSNSRLSGYENEQREPSLDDFRKIADLCHVDPAWLAFGELRLSPELAQIVQRFPTASDAIKDSIRAGLRITAHENRRRSAE